MSAMRAIYGGLRQLGIEDDDKRDLYAQATGKRSLRDMTPKEHEAVLALLRQKGFKKAAPKGRMQGTYAGKLQALWIGAWNLGIIRNRSDHALTAFIKRQTGIDHSRFLRHGEDANKAIEAIKGWMTRKARVDWSLDPLQETYKRRNGYKIAVAQWARLIATHPDKASMTFLQFVKEHGQKHDLAEFDERDWIPVMNRLGVMIREQQAAQSRQKSHANENWTHG